MTQKTIVLLFFSSSVPSGRTLCTMVKITASRFYSHDKNQKLFSLLGTRLSLLVPPSHDTLVMDLDRHLFRFIIAKVSTILGEGVHQW